MLLCPCCLLRLLQMFLRRRFFLSWVRFSLMLENFSLWFKLGLWSCRHLCPWESLPSAREPQTGISFSREPSVWQIGGLGILRMKLPSKKNNFRQHVCDTEQSYVEQWPCQGIAGESSCFSLLCNTLSPKLFAVDLPFYCFFFFFPSTFYGLILNILVCSYDALRTCSWKDKESPCYFNIAMQ